MDMDDDFIGTTEFDLSADQAEVVNRAISIASSSTGDEFAQINPLIAIMRWWETQVPQNERHCGSAETTLVKACRRFLLEHDTTAAGSPDSNSR
jgi:hypothetical protein